MAIPDGYVALDFVGFTDKGIYDSGVTYMTNDLIHDSYNNIWRCIKDDTSNVDPVAGEYWAVFINATDSLSGNTATDTYGVAGQAGQVIVAQSLVDAIADKVMNNLISKSKIVNDLVSTDPSTVLAGPMGTALSNQIVQLNSDLASLIISRTQDLPLTAIPANGSVDIAYTPSQLAGYTPLAYIAVAGGSVNTGITAVTSSIVRLRNFSGTSVSASPTISILYKKS